jgi:hypothetical protein
MGKALVGRLQGRWTGDRVLRNWVHGNMEHVMDYSPQCFVLY